MQALMLVVGSVFCTIYTMICISGAFLFLLLRRSSFLALHGSLVTLEACMLYSLHASVSGSSDRWLWMELGYGWWVVSVCALNFRGVHEFCMCRTAVLVLIGESVSPQRLSQRAGTNRDSTIRVEK